jgi:hypothetical protein
LRCAFDMLGTWLTVLYTNNGTDGMNSLLKAKWQSPLTERQIIAWMQRRTRYLNAAPAVEQRL